MMRRNCHIWQGTASYTAFGPNRATKPGPTYRHSALPDVTFRLRGVHPITAWSYLSSNCLRLPKRAHLLISIDGSRLAPLLSYLTMRLCARRVYRFLQRVCCIGGCPGLLLMACKTVRDFRRACVITQGHTSFPKDTFQYSLPVGVGVSPVFQVGGYMRQRPTAKFNS